MPVAVQEPSSSKPPIRCYPNPNDGNFMINYQLAENTSAKLSIVDMMGRIFFEKELSSEENQAAINLQNAPVGMYFVSIRSKEGLIYSAKINVLK